MSFLAEVAKKRAERRQQSSKAHDEYLATLSNDETSADELRNVFKWVILPLFFFWVAYVGYIHLSKELIGVVPVEHVWWLAICIPLAFQFIKAYCATKCLRAFHFKWYDKSAQDFWIYTIMAAFTVFAFVWTLKISFWDVKETAKANYVEQNTVTLSSHLSAVTAPIDARLSELEAKERATGNLRTKKGRVDWSAQPIIAENSKAKAALEAQRQTIVEAATQEFQNNGLQTAEKAKSRGDFFQRFGGFGELGEILCFILIGLLEAKLRRLNSDNGQDDERSGHTPPPHYNGSHKQPAQESPFVQNNGRYTFFNRRSDGTVRNAYEYNLDVPQPLFPTPENTVSQSQRTVSQSDGDAGANWASDVLKLAEKEIRGFAAGFDGKGRNNSTVSKNINHLLDATLAKMKQNGFEPSRPQWLKFHAYTQGTLFPLLNEKGWPYDRQTTFLQWLEHRQPAPVEA